MLSRVSIATNRHVPAGHHKLELVVPGLAEDGDVLLVAKAAGVVLELLVDPLDPVGVEDALVDLADQGLLVLGVEIAVDGELLGVLGELGERLGRRLRHRRSPRPRTPG